MKIATAQLEFQSAHQLTVEHKQSESLEFWVGQRNRETSAEPRPASSDGVLVKLSDEAARKKAEAREKPAGNFKANGEFIAAPLTQDTLQSGDPHLSLVRALLEQLFGQKIEVFNGAPTSTQSAASPETAPATSSNPATEEGNAPPASAGWGLAYDYQESYSEQESTSFSVSGKVQTGDGRQIDFSLSLQMERSYVEKSSVRIRAGDAVQLEDPLVLNFDGTAASLTDWSFAFDLNADGNPELMPFVTPGKGLLAFDRNANGVIDDGSELFGPSTGNGFSELAALDSDGNGWIDENDSAFKDLRIWSKSAPDQDQLQTLGERGVGALSLAALSTPFSLRNSQNQALGELRQSGLFLQEDGKAGTMQQVDIAV